MSKRKTEHANPSQKMVERYADSILTELTDWQRGSGPLPDILERTGVRGKRTEILLSFGGPTAILVRDADGDRIEVSTHDGAMATRTGNPVTAGINAAIRRSAKVA